MRKSVVEKLENLGACSDAMDWVKTQPSIRAAWETCWRGDWMLWILGKMSGSPESSSRKKLVLCVCQCARLSLKHVEKGEKRPLTAIETAEEWANGKAGVSLDDVRDAASDSAYYAAAAADAAYSAYSDAAYSAYSAYYAYSAASAASDAASDAASSASSASDSAYYASASASASADAAYAAASAVARKRTLEKCACIVRKFYPKAPKTMKPSITATRPTN